MFILNINMFQKEREVYIVWPFWPIIPFSCINNNNNNNISITKQITYNLRPIIWPTYKNKKKRDCRFEGE